VLEANGAMGLRCALCLPVAVPASSFAGKRPLN